MELPNYTHLKCQEVAEGFLTEHGFIQKKRLPVEVEILAQRAGIRVHVIPGIYARYGVKGIAYKKLDEKRFEILVDDRHYEYEEQSAPFTIAEELGHILIHAELFDSINSVGERIKFEAELDEQTRQHFEMQAKRIGSYLLLPSNLFNPFVLTWCEENIEKIKKDNPANEDDLAYFISSRLQLRINLSRMIIERALLKRWTPTRLIDEIITKFEIPLLDRIPDNRKKNP